MDAHSAIGATHAGDHPEKSHEEAFAELCEMARRAPLPAELLARQALRVTEGADWRVARAAMEALLRRMDFATRDDLRIERRPTAIFGEYRTRSRGVGSTRPYRTVLLGVDPPAGSCDCPDFLRGSLGLCKHLLVVLRDLHAKPRKLAAALRKQSAAPKSILAWDPIRPLLGAGDWLDRVRLTSKDAPPALRRRFDSRGKLRDACYGRHPERGKLVDELRAIARRDRHAPALAAMLQDEHERLERAAAGIDLASRDLRGIKRKLYRYQIDGLRQFLATGRLLLADDMGLGKTTQAIAACHVLFDKGRVRRGIVVAPASLKSQWLREWRETTDAPVEVVDGNPAERAKQYRGLRSGFLIVNYEQLLRDLDRIHALAPDLVVLDEAQRIKNWATKTAVYVKSLRPRYRLVLTGTPMENRLDEIASIFDWVDDFALEPKWRLAPWHTLCESDAAGGRHGARNLDTLRARLAPAMLRRVRQDVLKQLPPRTDTRVPVELTPQQLDAHGELDQPIAELIAKSQKRPLRQAEFLQLMSLMTVQRIICNGLAQKHFDAMWPDCEGKRPTPARLEGLLSPKLAELRRLVADLAVAQERKVVVFSQWRRMLRLADWAISDVLGDAGLSAVFFTGAESQRQRQASVVAFHDDPRVRVMFLSDAGGVGLNLQRAASACVNVELPWNPAVLEQRIGRIYRLGQRRPIDVYNLVSEQGIESRIAQLVGDKRALFTGLFDGTSNEVRFEAAGSVVKQIARLVEAAALPDLPPAANDADDEEPASGVRARDLDVLADATEPAPSPIEPPAAVDSAHAGALATPADVTKLISALTVRRTDAGGLAIEAPPEAAAALATLFGKMAELLAAQAR